MTIRFYPGDSAVHDGQEVIVLTIYPGYAVDSPQRMAMVRGVAHPSQIFARVDDLRRPVCPWCATTAGRAVCAACRSALRGAVSVPDGEAGALTVAA